MGRVGLSRCWAAGWAAWLGLLPAAAADWPVGQSRQGLNRDEPLVLQTEGTAQASPTLALDAAGRPLVAWVRGDDGRERIRLRRLNAAGQLGVAQTVWSGARAWRPRLAAGAGRLWLIWCGRRQAPSPGDHGRHVFARRLDGPRPGPVLRLSQGAGRACDPAAVVTGDGSLHVVWEQSSSDRPAGVRVAHRVVSPVGEPLAEPALVSAGPFDRRPALVAADGGLVVAWDRLRDAAPNGGLDPDYDLLLRRRSADAWQAPLLIDPRPGIQAAPALAVAPGGGVLLAAHSSHHHGLVKWWQLYRIRGRRVESLASRNAAAWAEPAGEQQGAEFPSLAVLADGRPAIAARRSQGALLQMVDAAGVSPVLDLTRAGWGARGMRSELAAAADGGLWLARRGRRRVVLEHFASGSDCARPASGPPAFVQLVAGPRRPPRLAFAQPLATPGTEPLAGGDLKAAFGDLHMHSAVSDGTGAPDEILARAWVRGLHFAALTDHDNIVGRRLLASQQDEIAWLTDAFDARPGFCALHGYEWTTPPTPRGHGHRNVYYRAQPPAEGWCGYRGDCGDSTALFAALAAGRTLAVPHHTSWTGTDWQAAEPDVQRLVEIVSVHGLALHPQTQPLPARGELAGMTAVDGLRRGLRFGFAGGSDAHGLVWHHGVGRKRDPWACGLTVVWVERLERAAVFDALRGRRTAATTGAPIRLFFRAAGRPMGAVGRATAPVRLQARVSGARPPLRLDVFRDGRSIHRRTADHTSAALDWMDRGVDPGTHAYYIQVVQTDAEPLEAAWSSPVFIRVAPAAGRSAGERSGS